MSYVVYTQVTLTLVVLVLSPPLMAIMITSLPPTSNPTATARPLPNPASYLNPHLNPHQCSACFGGQVASAQTTINLFCPNPDPDPLEIVH